MSDPLTTTDRLNAVLDNAEQNSEGALDEWTDLCSVEFVDHFEDYASELQKSPYNQAAKIKDAQIVRIITEKSS